MSSLHLAQALLLSAALGARMFLICNAGAGLLLFIADTHIIIYPNRADSTDQDTIAMCWEKGMKLTCHESYAALSMNNGVRNVRTTYCGKKHCIYLLPFMLVHMP